jgi:hypothetical protein
MIHGNSINSAIHNGVYYILIQMDRQYTNIEMPGYW